jgi:hypothetical protein
VDLGGGGGGGGVDYHVLEALDEHGLRGGKQEVGGGGLQREEEEDGDGDDDDGDDEVTEVINMNTRWRWRAGLGGCSSHTLFSCKVPPHPKTTAR